MKQVQVSGQIWAGGHSSCIMRFLYCPSSFASVSGHKSEREAGNQATYFYVLYVCVLTEMRQTLTCDLSKVELWREVEARSLFLERLQMRLLCRPRLCCRTETDEGKVNANVKTSIKIYESGIFTYWCAEKLWTHWRGTWFCPFWLHRLCRASQRYQPRVCSQGRSPCASQHAHEWWNCSKLFHNDRRLTDCYALGALPVFQNKAHIIIQKYLHVTLLVFLEMV